MISEELKARLQKETARIHELARLTGDDALLTYKVKFLYDHPLIYWQKRIEAAHGLLINKNLALAQAEIAKLHGLVYEKNANNGRWIVQDDLMLINNNQLEYSLDETRRSDSYFYEKKTRFSSVVEDVVKKTKDSKCSTDTNKFTFPKVDLALLAHACQLPIDALLVCIDPINVLAKEELKICKDEIFNQYINFHNNGKDLFSNDITFLEQFSQRANNKIIIQHLSNQAESTPAKPEIQAVAEEIAEPNKPQHEVRPGIALRGVKQLSKSEKSINIVADKPISIQINKPEYFSSWEAIVFEKDSENRIKLISTSLNIEDEPITKDELVVIPCSDPKKVSKPAFFCLDTLGNSKIFTLLIECENEDNSILKNLPVYKLATEAEFDKCKATYNKKTEVREEDFEIIRRSLLQRDRSKWQCLYQDITVIAA